MKSSFFVACSSLFLLLWLAASYATQLKPEPRNGKTPTTPALSKIIDGSENDAKPLIADRQD